MDNLAELRRIAALPWSERVKTFEKIGNVFDPLLREELSDPANHLPRNWTPRPYQQKVWDYLEQGGRRACLIWHRRSGKDDVALNWTAVAAHRRVGEYWHMLPQASQARKAIWDAVNPHTGFRRTDQAFPRELREKTREDEMAIRFKNGSLWRVVGSDNYESLLGSSPCGVVFSEWALADPNAWAFLRPILRENQGWALFITTPRGDNHAKKTFNHARQAEPSWFAQWLPAEQTDVFTAEELGEELKEYQNQFGLEEGKALWEQEYHCSWESALIGSFYGSYLNRAAKDGRIGRIPIDRALMVHTAWDLGISDSTAIWFIQCAGKERRLVDYHEGSGVGLDEYVRVLTEKQKQHGWIYGKHYFPHDITVRELGNRGLSRADTLEGMGVHVTVVPNHSLMDGINATRRLLDYTWIDETRCERGLNALRNYRREWDERLKMFRDKPLHDWSSHGASALKTFASGHRDPKQRPNVDVTKHRIIDVGRGSAGTGWMAY